MAESTPEKEAKSAMAERLAKLSGSKMTAIGSETCWVGVDSDGTVGVRAGEGTVKTTGSVEKTDGVASDA